MPIESDPTLLDNEFTEYAEFPSYAFTKLELSQGLLTTIVHYVLAQFVA